MTERDELEMTISKSKAKYYVIDDSIEPRRDRSMNAGLDIAIQEDRILQPGETYYFRAGVRFEIPDDMCVNVVTRSSTFKKGVVVVPSIVDSNYRDEISTIVTNTSSVPVKIEKGWRLAQCILQKWYMFDNEDETIMSDDVREKHHKFGSSGD